MAAYPSVSSKSRSPYDKEVFSSSLSSGREIEYRNVDGPWGGLLAADECAGLVDAEEALFELSTM